jgi:hypothetical protein
MKIWGRDTTPVGCCSKSKRRRRRMSGGSSSSSGDDDDDDDDDKSWHVRVQLCNMKQQNHIPGYKT